MEENFCLISVSTTAMLLVYIIVTDDKFDMIISSHLDYTQTHMRAWNNTPTVEQCTRRTGALAICLVFTMTLTKSLELCMYYFSGQHHHKALNFFYGLPSILSLHSWFPCMKLWLSLMHNYLHKINSFNTTTLILTNTAIFHQYLAHAHYLFSYHCGFKCYNQLKKCNLSVYTNNTMVSPPQFLGCQNTDLSWCTKKFDHAISEIKTFNNNSQS